VYCNYNEAIHVVLSAVEVSSVEVSSHASMSLNSTKSKLSTVDSDAKLNKQKPAFLFSGLPQKVRIRTCAMFCSSCFVFYKCFICQPFHIMCCNPVFVICFLQIILSANRCWCFKCCSLWLSLVDS